jgi:hypothetical protein
MVGTTYCGPPFFKFFNDVIRYFENHRDWMKYDEYLRLGYPIGAGVVQSTCGHTVKNRMEGTGRRWSIEGAEATLLLRSIYTSNHWQAYWQSHMRSQPVQREALRQVPDLRPSLLIMVTKGLPYKFSA